MENNGRKCIKLLCLYDFPFFLLPYFWSIETNPNSQDQGVKEHRYQCRNPTIHTQTLDPQNKRNQLPKRTKYLEIVSRYRPPASDTEEGLQIPMIGRRKCQMGSPESRDQEIERCGSGIQRESKPNSLPGLHTAERESAKNGINLEINAYLLFYYQYFLVFLK